MLFILFQVPTPTLFPPDMSEAPIIVEAGDWGMWSHMPYAIQVWNRFPDGATLTIQAVVIVAIVVVFIRLMIGLINKMTAEGDA